MTVTLRLPISRARLLVKPIRPAVEAAQARGLSLCEDRIRKPDEKKLHGSEMEAFGYREMTALAGQAERPDGVFVYPDLVGRGVILGALASGLSIPDDLRLVFHENIGMPLSLSMTK